MHLYADAVSHVTIIFMEGQGRGSGGATAPSHTTSNHICLHVLNGVSQRVTDMQYYTMAIAHKF